MVPTDFATFFATMAGVGATLFGLIFVVISIAPERTVVEDAPVMRQVQAASAYTALLNPLVISLIVLVPHGQIGLVTLLMSIIGLMHTLMMGLNLLRFSIGWSDILRRGFFILGGLVIYGFEILYAMRSLQSPGDLSSLYDLTTLLVIIYMYGVARAWELVGARQFDIQDLLFSLTAKKNKQSSLDTAPSDAATGITKDRN